MPLSRYLQQNAALVVDPSYVDADFFHDLYVDEADMPFFAFIRKAALAHGRAQAELEQALPPGDARQEVLRGATANVAKTVRTMEYELKRTNRYRRGTSPETLDLSSNTALAETANGPEGWLALGLSALFLELVLAHAGKLGEEQFGQFHGPLQAMGKGFGYERAFALSEAVRLAGNGKEAASLLLSAVERFRVPGEAVWGNVFVVEARKTLGGRFKSHRVLAGAALAAIRSTPGLPADAWRYVEPHLKRHGHLFGIGPVRRLAVRATLVLF